MGKDKPYGQLTVNQRARASWIGSKLYLIIFYDMFSSTFLVESPREKILTILRLSILAVSCSQEKGYFRSLVERKGITYEVNSREPLTECLEKAENGQVIRSSLSRRHEGWVVRRDFIRMDSYALP